MRKNLTLVLTLLFFSIIKISAQKVTGDWYGVGSISNKGEQSNYLSELVLTQKGNKVTGQFNYFFKSMSVTNKVSGTFDENTRTLELKLMPFINYKASNLQGADCPMEGSFTLRVSKVESSLYGQFNPSLAYRYTCPAITIKFVKAVNKPKEEVIKEEIEVPVNDVTEEAPKVIPTPNAEVTAELITRAFEAPPVIEVDADSLKVSLYDNGDVDNDTISFFYNRKLISAKQMLSTKALTYTLPLDTTINEISMFAENLGTIAPNTALAIIYAGEERFELNMTSNFIKNAAIRFRRKPKTEEAK
ncbi:MAG: hypothetical protein JWQ96_2322 [Segetibacter sp.]|nr:hypothetical protein [Segetibacter sp.]